MIVDTGSNPPLSRVKLVKQNLELNYQVNKLACSVCVCVCVCVCMCVEVVERNKDDPLLSPAVPKIVSVCKRKL